MDTVESPPKAPWWRRYYHRVFRYWASIALAKINPSWWGRSYFCSAVIQKPGEPPASLLFVETLPALVDIFHGFSYYVVNERLKKTYADAAVALISWSRLRPQDAARFDWACREGVKKGENPWGAEHERRQAAVRRREIIKPVEAPREDAPS